MMSSRWPRPTGTMESMALRPVCTGCDTLLRKITPGATRSSGAFAVAVMAPLPSIGLPKRIDHAAEHLRTHGHFEDAARGLHGVAFDDALVVAQHHGADRVLLEVQRQAEQVGGELQHFAVARVAQAVNAHDAVGDADHGADVAVLGCGLELIDARLDEVADFRCLDGHDSPSLNTCRSIS